LSVADDAARKLAAMWAAPAGAAVYIARWARIEVAAHAVIESWDDFKRTELEQGYRHEETGTPFELLRKALAATVGGSDQPSPGGGDPTAGK